MYGSIPVFFTGGEGHVGVDCHRQAVVEETAVDRESVVMPSCFIGVRVMDGATALQGKAGVEVQFPGEFLSIVQKDGA